MTPAGIFLPYILDERFKLSVCGHIKVPVFKGTFLELVSDVEKFALH